MPEVFRIEVVEPPQEPDGLRPPEAISYFTTAAPPDRCFRREYLRMALAVLQSQCRANDFSLPDLLTTHERCLLRALLKNYD
jgi:hypothetical protein